MQPNEVEVFRLILKEDCYYKTTTCTRQSGRWPNVKYYSTNELQYVGKFIENRSEGYRDNATHWAVFDNNGIEVIIYYTYEGTTCFVQVVPKIIPELKDQIIKSIYHIPSLKSLAKFQLSTEEIRLANEFGFF